jgi:hypothetical protein
MIRLSTPARLMGNEFKNEVFSRYDPDPTPACHHCGEKPALVRSMLDSLSGRTVRMFKCECGEQTWSEDKK